MNTSTISVSMNLLTSNVRSVNVSSDCLRYLVNLTKNLTLKLVINLSIYKIFSQENFIEIPRISQS